MTLHWSSRARGWPRRRPATFVATGVLGPEEDGMRAVVLAFALVALAASVVRAEESSCNNEILVPTCKDFFDATSRGGVVFALSLGSLSSPDDLRTMLAMDFVNRDVDSVVPLEKSSVIDAAVDVKRTCEKFPYLKFRHVLREAYLNALRRQEWWKGCKANGGTDEECGWQMADLFPQPLPDRRFPDPVIPRPLPRIEK
jgi:hypothetical protein